MIRMITENDIPILKTMSRKDLFLSRILCNYEAYGKTNIADFWVQTQEGRLNNVLCRVDDVMTICHVSDGNSDELDGFLYALLMFVVIDYATGLMAAFVQKKVSSEVGFKGICKKVAIFCLVGIGHVLDTQVIQNGSVLRTAVIFFYLSNEGISIIENVALIGLPVPKKLKEVLEQLHEEADEKKEDE